MKRFYSVLKLTSVDGAWCFVVTESPDDEKRLRAFALAETKTVEYAISPDHTGKGIFYGEFPS